MIDSGYPKVRQSLGYAVLQDPYPACFLDSRGVIYAANLTAFWLWNTIRPGEPLRPNALLGSSFFNLLSDNLERIPVEQNVEFYAKRASVVKRLDANRELPLYASFVTAMKAHASLAYIYESAPAYADHEWEYSLRIAPPGMKGSAELLEFQVTDYRLEGNLGVLVVYNPIGKTLAVIEEQFSELITVYGDKVYVLADDGEQNNGEGDQLLTLLRSSSRTYYPTLIQDSLWYIIGENRANQLLVGGSVVGMHFFEMLLAPQLREYMGPLQETSAPRAIRYFDTFTASFLQENHELHAEYEQVMKRLLRLPDFGELLDLSRKLHITLNLPEHPGVSFYTCRVFLPCPLSYEIPLQFRSMARLISKNLLVQSDSYHYQVTLVPENYETEVALMLLHLLSPASKLEDTDEATLKQFLWGLAVLTTIKEGLTWKDEENRQWQPEAALERILSELDAKFNTFTEDTIGRVIVEIKMMIEMLDQERIVDKRVLLGMLKGFVATNAHLDDLGTFFGEELEVHTEVEEYSREASKPF